MQLISVDDCLKRTETNFKRHGGIFGINEGEAVSNFHAVNRSPTESQEMSHVYRKWLHGGYMKLKATKNRLVGG